MTGDDHFARARLRDELLQILKSTDPSAVLATSTVLTNLEAEAGRPAPGRLTTHYSIVDEALESLNDAGSAETVRQQLGVPGATGESVAGRDLGDLATFSDKIASAILACLGLITAPKLAPGLLSNTPGRGLADLELPARVASRYQEFPIRTVRELLSDWQADLTTNFCLVVGPFGAGKSQSVRDVFADAKALADRGGEKVPVLLSFAELLERISPGAENNIDSGTLYVVDGYEEVSLVGNMQSPADARPLQPLLENGNKVLVASRKSSAAESDELLDQVFDVARHTRLGLNRPRVVEILPIDPDVAAKIADGPDSESVIGNFFREAPEEQSAQLRRPLTLSMIIALDPAEIPTSGIGLAWLYEQYVRATGSYDYDRGASALPYTAKNNILRRLAGDAFQPTEPRRQHGPIRADVELRVSEEVAQNPRLRDGGSHSESWTTDFLETNHIFFRTRRQTGPVEIESYAFVHHSFYEYFLALDLLSKLNNDMSFGFFEDKFSPRAFDSLVPGFMKAMMSDELETHLLRMVRRRRLPDLDRLLGLYLLEDANGVVGLIKGSPDEYHDFLTTRLATINSHFLNKAMRFQLIMLSLRDEDGIEQACDFVEYVTQVELDAEQDVELHVFGATSSPQDFLLARLRNEELFRAHPIFAFRLGQYGSREAIIELRLKRASTKSRRYARIVEDAILSIESREPEEK